MGFFVDVVELGQDVFFYHLLSSVSIIQPVLHTNVWVSHYRPGQVLGTPRGEFPRITRQSAHEGGKFVSPKQRPPLRPPCRRYSFYSFLLGAESNTGP